MEDEKINNSNFSNNILPFYVSIHILQYKGKPAIELRTLTTNPECMKTIIKCAYHEIPIRDIVPKFQNRLKALASLTEKGLIYYDPSKREYFFTF